MRTKLPTAYTLPPALVTALAPYPVRCCFLSFADYMKNKSGIPKVKSEKETYKSLTSYKTCCMARIGLNIVMAHACRQWHTVTRRL